MDRNSQSARDNDYSYYSPGPQLNNFRPDNFLLKQRIALPPVQKPVVEITEFLAPDLKIDNQTLRLPEIQVRDLDSSVWTYKNEGFHFDAARGRLDSYSATLHPMLEGSISNHAIAMELGDMKFDSNRLTPQQYSRTYVDERGNSFRIDRKNQKVETNPSYQSFVRYFERQSHKLEDPMAQPRPVDPSREVVTAYEERWQTSSLSPDGKKETNSTFLKIDSIGHNSELQRFITDYQGTVENDHQKISFSVRAPHDPKGKIQSLTVTLSARGAPTATISWKPESSQDSSKGFELLRDKLPAPLLLGPRTSFRLNNSDIPETALNVTKEGTLNSNQIGSPSDLAQFSGKEDWGINIAYSAPDKNSASQGFSIGNAVRNLWYRLTGNFSEVKNLREHLTVLRDSNPEKFVLAAGFQNPAGMSLKNLRAAARNAASIQTPTIERSLPERKVEPLEIFLKGNEKRIIPMSQPIAEANIGVRTRAHIRQEGDQYILSKGKVSSSPDQALGIGSVLFVEGKTKFPQYGVTVYAGKIQLGSKGIKIGPNTLFQNKEGTFLFNQQMGVVPAVVEGDRFTIQPSFVTLANGKVFQFENLQLEGAIVPESGRAQLLNKAAQSDAIVDGKPSAEDVTYAIAVQGNKITTITTLYKDTGLPQPDQSFQVAAGATTNNYYFAQTEASNPGNTPAVRAAYLALQTVVLPIALAEQAVTYTLNMPYFASQGGQYLARATLQPNWGDKAVETLQAISAFSNAFLASEPLAMGLVKGALKATTFLAQNLNDGLANRLNRMNYSVEARGLGVNGGNINIKFSERSSPLQEVAGRTVPFLEQVPSTLKYKIAEGIKKIEPLNYQGVAFRNVNIKYAADFSDISASMKFNYRYNIAGEFGAGYYSEIPEQTFGEMLAHGYNPIKGRALIQVEIKARLLDLTNEHNLARMGINESQITANSYSLTQEIALQARNKGFEGIMAPSAVGFKRSNVVIFTDRFGPESYVRKIDQIDFK